MFLRAYNISCRKEFPPQVLQISKSEGPNLEINLPPKTEQAPRLKRKPPKLAKKNKGGAPKGNRNAFKTGLHTVPAVEMRRQVRACIVQMKRVAAAYHLYAAMRDIETASMRRAAAQASNRAAIQPTAALR